MARFNTKFKDEKQPQRPSEGERLNNPVQPYQGVLGDKKEQTVSTSNSLAGFQGDDDEWEKRPISKGCIL